MSQLMLVNPRKRKSTRRSAAQKAATRKLVAYNKRRSSPKRKATTKRRKNPVGLSRVARAVNPKKRSVRRRNPITLRGLPGKIADFAMPSLQGALGAIAVNTALNYVPMLPAVLTTGNGKYLTRAGTAVLLGVFGRKVLGAKMANSLAVGAITVAAHDLILGMASNQFPNARLGDVGDYDSGVNEYVEFNNGNMNEYVDGMGNVGDVYDQR